MASLHTWKSIQKASEKGAVAGNPTFVASNVDLWDLSKRELIEAALHLAALATDSYDEAILMNGGRGAADRLREEIAALRQNGLI